MTARVDHEARRAQIAEALLRIADTQGLQSASMRAVAAEAGVSLRLVQYYFTTKDALLLDALARLRDQLQARMTAWIAQAGSPPTPRSVVTAILGCILPTDSESRRITRTYNAYYTLVLNEPGALEKQERRSQTCWRGSSPSRSRPRRTPARSTQARTRRRSRPDCWPW
ncbi:TetR/AcrR family transcriptional regulator [Catenulispora yoronensis]